MIFITAAVGRSYYLAGILAVSLFISLIACRYASGGRGRDYFHGGKDSSFFSTSGALFAAVYGVFSLLSTVRSGFEGGFAGFIPYAAASFALFVLAYAFCGGREKGYSSLPAELARELRAPRAFEFLLSLLLILAQLLLAGEVISAGAGLLFYFADLPHILIYGALFLAVFVHTVAGGYVAAERAGVWRLSFVLAGGGLLLHKSLFAAGGISALFGAFRELGRAKELSFLGYFSLSPMEFFSTLLLAFSAIFALPLFRSAVYSARDKSTARAGVFFTGALVLLFSFVPVLTGMAAAVLAANDRAANIINNPELAFAFIASSSGGELFGFLFVLGGIFSILSAVDLLLVSCADLFANNMVFLLKKTHVGPESYLSLSRTAVFFMAVFAFALPFFPQADRIFSSALPVALPSLAALVLCVRLSRSPKWIPGALSLLLGAAAGLAALFGSFPPWSVLFSAGPVIPSFLATLLSYALLSKGLQFYHKRFHLRIKRG